MTKRTRLGTNPPRGCICKGKETLDERWLDGSFFLSSFVFLKNKNKNKN
jgi:hypothetical protein